MRTWSPTPPLHFAKMFFCGNNLRTWGFSPAAPFPEILHQVVIDYLLIHIWISMNSCKEPRGRSLSLVDGNESQFLNRSSDELKRSGLINQSRKYCSGDRFWLGQGNDQKVTENDKMRKWSHFWGEIWLIFACHGVNQLMTRTQWQLTNLITAVAKWEDRIEFKGKDDF